jgi:hypothetical protein
MIHKIVRQVCGICSALMVAEIYNNTVSYSCVNKHELHPPLHFRDIANGE